MAAGDLFAWIRDRREVRAPRAGGDTQLAVAEPRTMIQAIVSAREPHADDRHLAAGRRIESAQVWLDSVEAALTGNR